jgi:hypothetical protein
MSDDKPSDDRQIPGWHHIDTAPKDGTIIEVLNARWWSRGNGRTDLVYWRQFPEPKHVVGHIYGEGFTSHTYEGRWEFVVVPDDREYWSWSHWRPHTQSE